MHATLAKFGYPDTRIRDYRHWSVLLRPAQPTLGALVLVSLDDATAFSDLEDEAAREMHVCIRDIETTLGGLFEYDRINYLMLMMVDPHVHFHVLPRYGAPRRLGGRSFEDAQWPGPPDLGTDLALEPAERDLLRDRLRAAWPGVSGAHRQ
ncbi:MAG: HIT family protein [Rhodothalassiaceae bacterium]